MSTAEAAALMAAGAFLALTVVLALVVVFAVVRMRREAEELRKVRAEAATVVIELQQAAAAAVAAAIRLDDRARHREAGTRLAYETLSFPVVKGLALASGVGQAARSLRKN